MKIVGTAEGAKQLPHKPYMNCYVDVSATFTREKLIMHYKIKSYFGRTNAEKNQHDS